MFLTNTNENGPKEEKKESFCQFYIDVTRTPTQIQRSWQRLAAALMF